MDAKIKERMLKILALAKGGVGGEQENAERMLETLCRKYGVTLEELEGVKVEVVWFYTNNKHEKSLLFQVVDMMVSDPERRDMSWKHAKRSRATGFKLTQGEAAQVKVGFETYKASWHEHVDAFFTAFVQKNRIFGMYEREHTELTAEQKERFKKAREMMRGIETTSVHQRIESK